MGKFFWGALCDRFDPRHVTATLTALTGLGLIFLFPQNSLWALILFIIVFGFAMGGVLSTLPVMIADLFGRHAYASVQRIVVLFMMIQYFGPLLMGLSYDHLASYNPAYVFFILLALISTILILSIKRPKWHENS